MDPCPTGKSSDLPNWAGSVSPTALPSTPSGICGNPGHGGPALLLTPAGDFHIFLDDGNEAASLALEKAFVEDRLTPELMLKAGGTIAPWFASITFGGRDLCTAYIGSLKGTRIPYFQSPVPGLPMVHWR